MKLTRRDMFRCGISSLIMMSGPTLAISGTQTGFDWKKTNKLWMQVLLPLDKYGPGADNPEVWERLSHLMQEKPDVARWIKLGMRGLSTVSLPKDKHELDAMLQPGAPFARFLKFYRRLLIENYYATGLGWKDLGFTEPPQPNGFSIPG